MRMSVAEVRREAHGPPVYTTKKMYPRGYPVSLRRIGNSPARAV